MKLSFTIFLPLLFINLSFGQNKFEIKNGSKKYIADIIVENCSEENCQGYGTVKLIDKTSKKVFQTFTSEDLFLYLDQNRSLNSKELSHEESPLIFLDFNFDGNEDLAIRNGNNSSYGGPSYDVYVSNSSQTKFILSDELTELAVGNLGMFEIDSKRKRIITNSKSVCCWHQSAEYIVIPKIGLKLVYSQEENATGGEFVEVTTKELIKNKWKTKIKKYKIKEFYKD